MTHADRADAWNYLAPSADSFWKWDITDLSVCWSDGSLIAFRGEIVPVLRRLAPYGLPTFDCIVLLLAACRQPDPISLATLNKNRFFTNFDDTNGASAFGLHYLLLQNLRWLAFRVSFDLRSSVEGKATLAARIFETAVKSVTPHAAKAILRFLEDGPNEDDLHVLPSHRDVATQFAALARSEIESITSEELALRRTTGLDEIPKPFGIEESPTRSLDGILAQMEDDEEHGGLARLTRRLSAALTIPRAVSEPQDLALGGVSDISNRGPLDRLLLSELAHDDLTFTVRIALSEALYLRREAPPFVPPRRRAILVDSGFRMWGLPRVYAMSAALALALSRERSFDVSLFRPREEAIEPIDIVTKEGLVKHLAALEIDIHPGAALPAFFERAREGGGDCEIVVVTCGDVLADPTFRQAMGEQSFENIYIVAVERSGVVRLFRRTQQESTLLRETCCSLDDVMKASSKSTPLIDPGVDLTLPAILRLMDFPLRMPHPINSKSVWPDGHGGLLAKTSDGRLMHWDQPRVGARQRTAHLPPGRLLWHAQVKAGAESSLAVVGRLSRTGASLVHIPLPTGPCRSHPLSLEGTGPLGFAGHGGAIFAIFADHIEVFSERDGRSISTLAIPEHHRWQSGRFFRFGDGFRALAFNGSRAEFVSMSTIRESRGAWPLAIVDVPGQEGAVVVTFTGHVYGLGPDALEARDESLIALPDASSGYVVRCISVDGSRVVMSPNGRSKTEPDDGYLLNLVDRTCERVPCVDANGIVNRHLTRRIEVSTLRNRFSQIAVDGESLILRSTAGHTDCRITWDENCRRIALVPRSSKHFNRPMAPFTTDVSSVTGVLSGRVTWKDGSRAYLDSRGLLHLVSSDRSISEMTFVLQEGTMSGWCADGGAWGLKYFEIEPGTITPDRVFFQILKPFVRRLQ